MFQWKLKATNAIFLEDNNGQQGRPFKARFLQAGLVKYNFGVCLLKKETIDKFLNTFLEDPVIINHIDDINSDDVCGIIQKVWFSAEDGWFWCSGILTSEKAIKLIEDGYNVSCQYRITDYTDNVEGKLHNANPYDKEILDGVFEHLAIVENPRYEDAFIAVNAYIATNQEFNEQEHPRDDEGKFTDGNGSTSYFTKWDNAPEIELKTNELSSFTDIKELRKAAQDYYKNNLQGQVISREGLENIRFSGKGWKEFVHTSADADKLRAVPQLPEIIKNGKLGEFQEDNKGRTDNIKGFYPIYCNLKTDSGMKKAEVLIAQDLDGNLFYTMFLDYDRPIAKNKRDITSNQDRLPLNFIIAYNSQDFNPNVTINKEADKYSKVFDYIRNTKGESMDNETKGIFKQLIDALKARNEAEEEPKKDKKEDEDAANKAKNADEDKRKSIDEVAGIMKSAGVDDELIRTAIAKMEKLAYDKSEAGTADNGKAKNTEEEPPKDEEPKKDEKREEEEPVKNKCKNEGDEGHYEKLYKELKEKVDEAENKKAKNALDDAVNQLYSAIAPKPEELYVSTAKGLELGKQIYG